jgi:hypothetical protein
MTEAEWLACTDPVQMLERVAGKISDRKLRLFAVACCREVWDLIELMERHDIGDGSVAVRLGEQFADGQADAAEVARWIIDRVGLIDSGSSPYGHLLCYALPGLVAADAHRGATQAARGAALARDRHVRYLGTQRRGEHASLPSEQSRAEGVSAQMGCLARLCVPLRDILGNPPFRPVLVDAAWRTPAVLSLAEAAYELRVVPDPSRPGWLTLDTARLLVLADALEEAGADEPEMLGHLRGPGEHVRGCHVVDAVLSKG